MIIIIIVKTIIIVHDKHVADDGVLGIVHLFRRYPFELRGLKSIARPGWGYKGWMGGIHGWNLDSIFENTNSARTTRITKWQRRYRATRTIQSAWISILSTNSFFFFLQYNRRKSWTTIVQRKRWLQKKKKKRLVLFSKIEIHWFFATASKLQKTNKYHWVFFFWKIIDQEMFNGRRIS